MSDDFQVGDVVVAVAEDECPYHAGFPDDEPGMGGKTYRVCGKRSPLEHEDGCCGYIAVGAEGLFCGGMFRKLPRADESFTEEMRALKPHRNRVPA